MPSEQFPKYSEGGLPRQQEYIYTPKEEERIFKAAASKAEALIKDSRFDPVDFIDLYGEKNIVADQIKLDAIKERIQSDSNEEDIRLQAVATGFQGFLADRISSGLLGSRGRAFHTSEYDDIINGVDVVSEVIDEEHQVGHLGFAIDVTFSQKKLDKKFSRISTDIQHGKLALIKYFRSDEIGHRGEFRVPRFVVGIDIRNLLPALNEWAGGKEDALSHNASGMVILKEIERQASVFGEYAKAEGQEALLRRYQRVETTISQARQNLRRESGISVLPKSWKEDRVASAIDSYLSNFKK